MKSLLCLIAGCSMVVFQACQSTEKPTENVADQHLNEAQEIYAEAMATLIRLTKP